MQYDLLAEMKFCNYLLIYSSCLALQLFCVYITLHKNTVYVNGQYRYVLIFLVKFLSCVLVFLLFIGIVALVFSSVVYWLTCQSVICCFSCYCIIGTSLSMQLKRVFSILLLQVFQCSTFPVSWYPNIWKSHATGKNLKENLQFL